MQKNKRYPQALKVLDRLRRGETRVGAPQLGRDAGMIAGESLDVEFVDDGLMPRDSKPAVVLLEEPGVDDDRLGHERTAVRVVDGQVEVGITESVWEDRPVPANVALDGLGVGVEQELGRVAAKPPPGVVGAMNAEAVALTRSHVR